MGQVESEIDLEIIAGNGSARFEFAHRGCGFENWTRVGIVPEVSCIKTLVL